MLVIKRETPRGTWWETPYGRVLETEVPDSAIRFPDVETALAYLDQYDPDWGTDTTVSTQEVDTVKLKQHFEVTGPEVEELHTQLKQLGNDLQTTLGTLAAMHANQIPVTPRAKEVVLQGEVTREAEKCRFLMARVRRHLTQLAQKYSVERREG